MSCKNDYGKYSNKKGGSMRKGIFYFIFMLISISQISFAEDEGEEPDSLKAEVQKTDTVKPEVKKPDTVAKLSLKTFIPGAVQYSNKETFKAWSIIGGETITLLAGGVCWYLSDSEYDKYKSLSEGVSQEQFDRHYNNSNLYGTISISSFIGFGAIYLYSVIDAIKSSHHEEMDEQGKTEEQGFYFVPKKDSIALYALLRF